MRSPLVLLSALLACSSTDPITGTTPPTLPATLALQTVAMGLSAPVYLTAAPGDARLFVVEQPGQVRVIQSSTLLPTPFLDISSLLLAGGEQGLLSLAFHPQYASNGYFYIYYTDLVGNLQIDRFTASSATTNTVSMSTRTPILTIPHPGATNHNGGLALFGPDGMLYLGIGDGGTGGANGQALNTLLGKLLRIDVNGGSPYTIPSNNPYVGTAGARGEIWARGLRNPWRYTFDTTDGLLYVTDVGQNLREEVNVVTSTTAAVNYGWNIMEGSLCYATTPCSSTGLQLPVFEYDHSGGQCAIVGGPVYRGSAIPGLAGHFLYSDACTGGLRSFRYATGAVTSVKDWNVGNASVLGFGVDANNEIYVLFASGTVSKVVAGT